MSDNERIWVLLLKKTIQCLMAHHNHCLVPLMTSKWKGRKDRRVADVAMIRSSSCGHLEILGSLRQLRLQSVGDRNKKACMLRTE